VFRIAVVTTVGNDDRRFPASGDVPVRSVALRSESELRHPVPDCRNADSKQVRNLSQRQAAFDKRLKLFAGEAAARRILRAAVRDEAVLSEPIAHGGWIASNKRAHLRKRETLLQVLL
jgi:hypothetical protein